MISKKTKMPERDNKLEQFRKNLKSICESSKLFDFLDQVEKSTSIKKLGILKLQIKEILVKIDSRHPLLYKVEVADNPFTTINEYGPGNC